MIETSVARELIPQNEEMIKSETFYFIWGNQITPQNQLIFRFLTWLSYKRRSSGLFFYSFFHVVFQAKTKLCFYKRK